MYPCSLGSCQNNQCTSKKNNFSSKVALCFLNFYIHSYAHISQETLCVAGRVVDPKCRHASRTEIGNRFSAGFAEHNNIRRLTGIKVIVRLEQRISKEPGHTARGRSQH